MAHQAQLPTKWPHFPNPPIVEAIFDIQYRLAEAFDIQTIQNAATDKFKPQYPITQQQQEAQFTITMPVTDAANPEGKRQFLGVRGFSFVAENKAEILQIRRDGFTLNRLKPYISFDKHLQDMLSAWSWVCTNIPVEEILRVSVRYINVIQIPLAEMPLVDQYFPLLPRIPEKMQVLVAGLLVQQRFRFDVPGVEAMVTLTHQPIVQDHLPMIFDIDIHAGQLGTLNLDELKSKFTLLREYKNRIFFHGTSESLQQKYL